MKINKIINIINFEKSLNAQKCSFYATVLRIGKNNLMGERVKKCPKLYDVIYGRTLVPLQDILEWHQACFDIFPFLLSLPR